MVIVLFIYLFYFFIITFFTGNAYNSRYSKLDKVDQSSSSVYFDLNTQECPVKQNPSILIHKVYTPNDTIKSFINQASNSSAFRKTVSFF